MPVILGLASSHDASACVFVDGRLAAAVSQERLTRRKNDGCRLPLESMAHALEVAGVGRADIDGVALMHSFFPEKYFRRESLAKEIEARLVRARRRMRGAERQLNVNDLLKRVAKGGGDIMPWFRRDEFLAGIGLRSDVRVRFYDHHATHAMAAAWYCGFDTCAVLTIDGVGELNIFHTANTWSNGTLVRLGHSDSLGASPGEYYEAITEAMGFIPLRHEGKVLGLAAHATRASSTRNSAARCGPRRAATPTATASIRISSAAATPTRHAKPTSRNWSAPIRAKTLQQRRRRCSRMPSKRLHATFWRAPASAGLPSTAVFSPT